MRINRDAHSALGAFVAAYAIKGGPDLETVLGMHKGVRPLSAKEAAALHGKERKAERLAMRYTFEDPYATPGGAMTGRQQPGKRLRQYDANIARSPGRMAYRIQEAVPFCWFCTAEDGKKSREHIFPLWLVRITESVQNALAQSG